MSSTGPCPTTRRHTCTESAARAARATPGTALTFVTPEEYRKLFRFKRAAGAGFKKAKVPEVDEVLSRKARAPPRQDTRAGRIARGGRRRCTEGEKPREKDFGASSPTIFSRGGTGPSALAAALFEAFGSEIDPARYRQIEECSVDAAATARLFVGVGKRDRATPKGLAALVKRISGLPDNS